MAKGTYHRVRDGQDIVFLAEWYYGDPWAASHIYYANLDIYGDDFEMIPAGSKVFIPDLEVSDTVEAYTGPTVPERKPKPNRGSTLGDWFVDDREIPPVAPDTGRDPLGPSDTGVGALVPNKGASPLLPNRGSGHKTLTLIFKGEKQGAG